MRLGRPLVLFAILIGVLGCNPNNGNGGGYVGGGDGSTQAQIESALQQVQGELKSTITLLASGSNWDELYAPVGCDVASSQLCADSDVESDDHRQFAKTLILESLSGLQNELVQNPVTISFVESFPTLVDSFGHTRSAMGVTSLARDSGILLSGPAYRALEPSQLKGAIAGVVIHEILHQLSQQVDAATIGTFTTADGVQECFQFSGTVIADLMLSLETNSPPDSSPGNGSNSQVGTSTAVAPVGLDSGKIQFSPEAVRYGTDLVLFGVDAETSRIFLNSYDGGLWSGYKPFPASMTSDVALSVVNLTISGVNSLLVAAVSGGIVHLYTNRSGPWTEIGSGVSPVNTTDGNPAQIYTNLSPKLTVSTVAGVTYLYLSVVGTDGEVYFCLCLSPDKFGVSLGGYQRWSVSNLPLVAQGIEMVIEDGNNSALVVDSSETVYQSSSTPGSYWEAFQPVPNVKTPYRPVEEYVDGAYWLAWVTDQGQTFVQEGNGATATNVAAPSAVAAPAIRIYDGTVYLFTLGNNGLISQTNLP